MKFHPEDPRLTACVLGQLTPEESAAVEQAAAADPAVLAALEETRRLQQQLHEALAPQPEALLPGQRESIRQAARQGPPEKPAKPAAHPRWLVPMVGVAVAGIAAMIWMHRPPDKHPPIVSHLVPPPPIAPAAETAPTVAPALPLPLALLPLPGPPVPGEAAAPPPAITQLAADVRDRDKLLHESPAGFSQLPAEAEVDFSQLPVAVRREPISTGVSRELPLPILAGHASPGWIARSVANHTLPPPAAVRLEEILNAISFRPAGTSAIFKGTSLSAESLSCPWKPSATLLLVHLQGAISGPRSIEAVLDIDPQAVSRYRLLGYAPLKAAPNATLPTWLPEKTGTTLLIELDPRASAKALGEIRWKVDGAQANPVPVLRLPDAEPSNDARYAALLAAWSMWLVREQPEIIDEELVAGLARQSGANDLPKERQDMMILIAKSLELR